MRKAPRDPRLIAFSRAPSPITDSLYLSAKEMSSWDRTLPTAYRIRDRIVTIDFLLTHGPLWIIRGNSESA
jgi:hypothetical protein